MAVRKRCLMCGEPVRANNYCMACGLNQDFLKKAINTSLYHYNIALDKARVRDLSGAVDSLNMALRYNKHNIEARNLLGLICYEIGDEVSAMGHWVMSVNYRPKNNDAVRYLKELKDDPQTLEAVSANARCFNQALSYAKQRNFDLAFLQLKKCLTANPHFVKGYLLYALMNIEQGREGKAKKALTKVLAIDRTNTMAVHYLREMGETDATIIRMVEEVEEESLYESGSDAYYGMEQEETESTNRPSHKITVPVDKRREEIARRNEMNIRQYKLSRYSNYYILAGIVLGIIMCYFLVMPSIRKSTQQKINEVEVSYGEKIAEKDGDITYLENEITALNNKVDSINVQKSDLQDKVDRLQKKVDEMTPLLPEDAFDTTSNDENFTWEAAAKNDGQVTDTMVGSFAANE